MSDAEFEVQAELDVPGETGRQTKVFGLWCACLFAAVVVSAYRRPIVPENVRGTDEQEQVLQAYRAERTGVALSLGLLLPGALTMLVTHRHRRRGAHARGITIDMTGDGEVRLWGRGYGQRLLLDGAEITERLVDLYSGRMGSWRQRRLSLRARKALPGSPSLLELGTLADESDETLGLPLVGGEGDCVELSRADYLALVERIRQRNATAASG